MPLFAEGQLERWNRRLHYFLGLYFLFFLWLFLLTGLLLNHGSWFAGATQRAERRYQQPVQMIAEGTDLVRARGLASQLGLTGEVDVPATGQPAGRFDFNVARPSDSSQVRIDLASQIASIQHFDNPPLATFRIFHTFSGQRFNAPETHRGWRVTSIWVFAMDALAVGLLVMVFGSYYMWYRLKRSHRLGWWVLTCGAAGCAMFFAAALL